MTADQPQRPESRYGVSREQLMVTLPSGITVPDKGGWLTECCPKADEHHLAPPDLDNLTGLSKTHRQAIHPVCGLWSLWLPRSEEPVP